MDNFLKVLQDSHNLFLLKNIKDYVFNFNDVDCTVIPRRDAEGSVVLSLDCNCNVVILCLYE